MISVSFVSQCVLFFILAFVRLDDDPPDKVVDDVILYPGDWFTNQIEEASYYDTTIECGPNLCDVFTMNVNQYSEITHNETEISNYLKKYENVDQIAFLMITTDKYFVVVQYPLLVETFNTTTNLTMTLTPSTFLFTLLEFMLASSIFMLLLGFCLFTPMWTIFLFCVCLVCSTHLIFLFPAESCWVFRYLVKECWREMMGRSVRRMYHTMFFWFLRTRKVPRKKKKENIVYVEMEEKVS